jgi:hypothetical protein
VNRLILWTGRLLAIILTVLCGLEIARPGFTGIDHRMTIIAFVSVVFTVLSLWQIYVAWKRDGWPSPSPSFRWVMALFLASLSVFVIWSLLVATFSIYRRELSVVMWWQLGMSSLYFFVRWINLGEPREAGIGETGTPG